MSSEVTVSRQHYIRGLIFLMLAQVMVSINIILSKILLDRLPFLVILTLRFAFAAVILFIIQGVMPTKNHAMRYYLSTITRQDWLVLIAQALCAGVLFNLFMLYGLQYTDANIAGIITSALPAFIALFAWLFLKEAMTGKKCICIIFATLGLVVLAIDKLHGPIVSHSFFGDLMVFLSLIPEAGYYILAKAYPNRLPIFFTSALINAVTSLCLAALLFWMHFDQLDFHPHDWIILALMGLSSALFFVFWLMGCQTVDNMMASLSTAIMPISTVILAWSILGEDLSSMELIGMLFVIGSILIYAKR